MGCWAATCALSGLTSYTGGVRMGLVILESGTASKTGGATRIHDDRLRMVTPPLWGKYDTYGRVEVEDSVEARHALEWVKKVIPNVESLKDAQGVLRDGAVSYEEPHHYEEPPYKVRDVHYALVREDVWNAMVRQAEELKPELRGVLRDAARKVRAGEKLSRDERSMVTALGGSFLGFGMPKTLAVLSYDKQRYYELDLKSATDEDIRVAMDVLYVQILMQTLRLEWSTGTGRGQLDNHQVRKTWFLAMSALCEKPGYGDEE